MTEDQFLIRYHSASTVNGEPVGIVYVQGVEWSEKVYSYTKDPEEATQFSEREAELLIGRARWPEARIVGVAEAEHLG